MTETSCIDCKGELPQGTPAIRCPHCGAVYCTQCCRDHYTVGEVVTCKNCGDRFTMEPV